MPLPYGRMTPSVCFTFGTIPVSLLDAFIAAGRAGLPNEIAGGLIYSPQQAALRLSIYDPLHSTAHGIENRMPPLARDESIAVDLHTHGPLPAFWSATDDMDDRSVKVAGVFGNLNREQPSAAFRLVLNGMYRPLAHPWQAAHNRLRATDLGPHSMQKTRSEPHPLLLYNSKAGSRIEELCRFVRWLSMPTCGLPDAGRALPKPETAPLLSITPEQDRSRSRGEVLNDIAAVLNFKSSLSETAWTSSSRPSFHLEVRAFVIEPTGVVSGGALSQK